MNISELRKSLTNIISGEVFLDKEVLSYYSVDASSYQVFPRIVVIPENEKDVINVVKVAKKYKISVTARGAGTGLVGSSLNSGIIMDLKKLNSIKIHNNHVHVGSGVIKGNLDKALEKIEKFFPPSPSVGPFCSAGGMIGNNSSGSRSLKYGSVVDNIEKITFVDGNGKKITLPQNKKTGRAILQLANKIDQRKFPRVTKNSSGYRLDLIKSLEHTHKSIAGSEGTLGIVLSAEFKILSIPKRRILFIIGYKSENDAALSCAQILTTYPSALEFVDKTIMKNIDHNFKKRTRCLLFVEYDSKIHDAKKKIEKTVTGNIEKILKTNSEIHRWWKFRDSSLYYSSKSIKNKTLHVIEDAAVPVERLPELFLLINDINVKYRTKSISYGHAGNGNIHVRLISYKKKLDIKKIADEFFDSVINLGGTITGEHGDGLARSEYVKKQYGVTNYKIFKELKNYFDPHRILNPGKIISCNSTIVKNLSYQ